MIDEETKAALETKHPGCAIVETDFGPAVFKKPDRLQRNKYLTMVNEGKIGEAADFLCIACAVAPDRATFTKWLDDDIGLALTVLIPPLLTHAGLAAREEGKA